MLLIAVVEVWVRFGALGSVKEGLYLKLASGAGVLCLVTIAVGWLQSFFGILAGVDSYVPLGDMCVCDCGVCLDWCGC